MKDIHTLVEDIYNLFSPDELQMDEKEIDKHVDEFATNIKEHLKLFLNEKPRSRSNLRLSAIGKKDRQLWYDMYTTEDKIIPLSSSTRIKFLYGYILEELLIVLSRLAGHTVTDMQKEGSVEGVKGHQDCMIDGVLVDCKSASDYSFKKFDKGRLERDDPFGYIAQISAYAEANDKDEAAFLVINKVTGEICLLPKEDMEKAADNYRNSQLNLSLLNNGVHSGVRFILSSTHTEADIDDTIESFERSLDDIRTLGLI